ncbi:hypothetical protein DLM_3218 [Aquitalea magnusonii]|uniref:Uncharacterized protein n=1 Tax=Aquitalea magnusonii TaxID=332411 RepID=A0A3G9GG09_9NEIS|nr:hypothetical protein DLM_3218 [Aquitalea magnusonii]
MPLPAGCPLRQQPEKTRHATASGTRDGTHVNRRLLESYTKPGFILQLSPPSTDKPSKMLNFAAFASPLLLQVKPGQAASLSTCVVNS